MKGQLVKHGMDMNVVALDGRMSNAVSMLVMHARLAVDGRQPRRTLCALFRLLRAPLPLAAHRQACWPLRRNGCRQ